VPPGFSEPATPPEFPLDWQVILAVGRHPSAQRNAALGAATGRWIWFLDSDCQPSAAAIALVGSIISADAPDVAGGPVVLPVQASARERIFQAALSHRWVTGPSAARYAPLGSRRASDEKELILANLLVRHALFATTGLFDERLYPNEENEWLDRVRGVAQMVYDPGMAVVRPQRATWGAFLWMLFRYGAGRMRQTLLARRGGLRLLAPGLLLLGGGLALLAPLVAAAGLAGLVLLLAWGAEGARPLGILTRLAIGIAGVLAVAAYALGQIVGLCWNPAPPARPALVELHCPRSRLSKAGRTLERL
jgi:GT2 family glycosyltransferase